MPEASSTRARAQALAERFLRETEKLGIQDARAYALFAREVFDAIADRVASTTSGDAPEQIAAPNAVIEVIDGGSGHLYRRYLELNYEENDNGLRLQGETMSGDATEIVFLSETAIRKIADLRGLGRNAPRCGDDDEKSAE